MNRNYDLVVGGGGADVLYVESLAAPQTVNTMPEKTLLALADHGHVDAVLPHDGGDAEAVLHEFTQAGVDIDALAARLQREGAESFVISWTKLLECIASKTEALSHVGE